MQNYVGRFARKAGLFVAPALITGAALVYSACGGNSDVVSNPTDVPTRPAVAEASATPYPTNTQEPTAVPPTATQEYKNEVTEIEFTHALPDTEQNLIFNKNGYTFTARDLINDKDRNCPGSYSDPVTWPNLSGYLQDSSQLRTYGSGIGDSDWIFRVTMDNGKIYQFKIILDPQGNPPELPSDVNSAFTSARSILNSEDANCQR